jgi:predicted type IV restriction endonuclease
MFLDVKENGLAWDFPRRATRDKLYHYKVIERLSSIIVLEAKIGSRMAVEDNQLANKYWTPDQCYVLKVVEGKIWLIYNTTTKRFMLTTETLKGLGL